MANVISNMAGNVWKVIVNTGDEVASGQEVVILESMKMEIPIEAETKGVVKGLKTEEGAFVNEGDILLELE